MDTSIPGHHNATQNRNIMTGTESLENVMKLKYLEIMVMN